MVEETHLNSLNDAWSQAVGDVLPVAHDLKWKLADRWLRIHTLPDSKQYPESEAEYLEVLRRHNKVLDSEVGCGSAFYLVVPGGDQMSDPIGPANIDLEGLSLRFWRTEKEEIDETETFHEHYFFSEINWESDCLDRVLMKVADEDIYGVILFCPSQKILYHPYDGGGDIVFETELERDAASIRYADWLPSRADGL